MLPFIPKLQIIQYNKDGEDFTEDEIKRGIHYIYQDIECRRCGLVIHRSNWNGDLYECPKCG